MGKKKNKGRSPKININEIPKSDREEAVRKYNKSPDTVRIYYNQKDSTLLAIDSSIEKRELNFDEGNIFFIIGGRKNKKDKINQADIIKAINDELEFWFYTDDDIYSEY